MSSTSKQHGNMSLVVVLTFPVTEIDEARTIQLVSCSRLLSRPPYNTQNRLKSKNTSQIKWGVGGTGSGWVGGGRGDRVGETRKNKKTQYAKLLGKHIYGWSFYQPEAAGPQIQSNLGNRKFHKKDMFRKLALPKNSHTKQIESTMLNFRDGSDGLCRCSNFH